MKSKDQRLENQNQRVINANQKKQMQDESLQHLIKTKVIEDQGIEYQDQKSFTESYEIFMHRGRAFLCSIDILEEPHLSAHAKILFQIISSLSFNEGYCYASNVYLSSKLGKGEESVKRYLNELDKFGLIKRDTYKLSRDLLEIFTSNSNTSRIYISPSRKNQRSTRFLKESLNEELATM